METQWKNVFLIATVLAHTTGVAYAQSVNNALTRADFTRADTVDKIDPKDMSRASAAVAVMAYVVADMEERLK